MIKVRKARVDDLTWMLGQAKEFYAYHPLPIKFDAAHTANVILDMIEDGVSLVAEKGGEKLGAIGGVITCNLFDPSYTTLAEMYLWVEKRLRMSRALHHLVKAFTEAGADVDAVVLCHTKLTPALGKAYEKKGYELMEISYVKEK